jgi:ferric-dicitrate binding protein FerR (iron transport regulator)
MDKERFLYLLEKHFQKTMSLAERQELSQIMSDLQENAALEEWMHRKWLSFSTEEKLPKEEASQYFNSITAAVNEMDDNTTRSYHKRTIPVRRWLSIAATLLIELTGTLTYIFIRKDAGKPQEAIAALIPKQDIAPGGNFATLTLGDGSRVVLDSSMDGVVARQGNIKVLKLKNGEIKYEHNKNAGRIFYNTMATPAGGQYHLVLPDGTGVWLNAASSITYPTAFSGTERKVSVTGEVYFEVTKNASMPFKVKTGEQTIEVLGTHFNVNAYDNESAVKTTLAEGKVRITCNGSTIILQPGQQAQNNRSGHLSLTDHPDMEETLAWKDGLFRFNGTDIETIMRQVARWYNVEVIYKDKINEQFVAEIPRSVKVSKLLELLELTKQVHFIISDKTITVTR